MVSKWLGRRGDTPRDDDLWDYIFSLPDAYGALMGIRSNELGTMMLGRMVDSRGPKAQFQITERSTSLLALGPPRSIKTSSLSTPITLTQPGPVVVVSTKPELAINTAMLRSRLGTVGIFAPDGEDIMEGFKEIRWSPIVGSANYSRAQSIAHLLVMLSKRESSGQQRQSSDNSHFFETQAEQLLAVLFNYAELADKSMRDVVDIVGAQDHAELQEILEYFVRLDTDGHAQARDLRAIIGRKADPRRIWDIFASARVALRPYFKEECLKATDDSDFYPDEFAQGNGELSSELHAPSNRPDIDRAVALTTGGATLPGQFDTVYIIATGKNQEEIAPIVIAFLISIRDATYETNRYDAKMGISHRRPVTMVLDEMYNMAAFPDLVSMLSEGGGQGMLLFGCLQDLNLAKAKWGDAGESMLTLWQNIAIAPGIRHVPTLDAISTLIGERLLIQESWSSSRNKWGGTEWNQTLNPVYRRHLPPDAIMRGDPRNPDVALVLAPGGGWTYSELVPYYRKLPWPMVIADACYWALQSKRSYRLPLPQLARDGNYSHLYQAGGSGLVEEWKKIQHAHATGGIENFVGYKPDGTWDWT